MAYDKALSLRPSYPEAIEYRGEAYLALNRVDDAKQAYLDLFAGNRKLADQLLVAMKSWVAEKRSASGGDVGRARGPRPVGAGTRADRGPDGVAHARGRERELALKAFASLVLIAGAAASVAAASDATAPYVWHLPRGFPQPAVPADNPMSEAKVALGRRLFFETTPLDHGPLQLRELSRSGARVHRWPRDRALAPRAQTRSTTRWRW